MNDIDYDDDYRDMAEMLQTFRTEGEREVYDYMKEKQRFRPRKINNVKKTPTKPPVERLEFVCTHCGGVDFVTNTDTTDTVCTGCATVLFLQGTQHNFDHDGTRMVQQNNAQVNYFKERMSQWCMREPGIPLADRLRLRDTYNGGNGTPDTGSFDPFLPKHEVRRLVIASGLAPKVYVEKWLTIRYQLGAEKHPYPETDELPNAMLEMFIKVLHAWNETAKTREKNGLHPHRSSLLNYNFLIRQFLLILDIEAYKLYAHWFPLVVESKQQELKHIWHSLCVKLGWPMLEAEWIGEELKVYRLQTLSKQ